MKITLLGTGSPIPDPNRAGPSSLVSSDGSVLLIDAGRGVVTRLVGAGYFPPMLTGVLLTHLHSDHISDLNDIITSYWVMSQPDSETPLSIWGPPGTIKLVQHILEMLQEDIHYRITHHDDLNAAPRLNVVEVAPGDVFTVGTLSVKVGETDHRPVHPSVAFRISDGVHDVVMAGDGVPCDSLDELLVGADAYVQTVLREDIVKMVPVARLQDILDYHSTVEQAAQTAQRAGIKHLILTHYVPAPPPGGEAEWAAAAKEHFSGNLVVGPDLTSIDLNA
jgi:ribonuclease Z